MSIMLHDPLFENDDEQIVNESLTFFLGGTVTSSTVLSNTIAYMV